MSRPHIMFVQAQDLAWEGTEATAAPWPEARLLSREESGIAMTRMVRIRKGERLGAGACPFDEEMLVIRGQLEMDSVVARPTTYLAWAAGAHRMAMRAADETIAVSFVGSKGSLGLESDSVTAQVAERGLEGWEPNPHTRYLVGTGTQTLRQNPRTGEITMLYAALPFRYMEHRWTHTCVQEMFLLAGEYVLSDVGVMTPGAYAWWNPGVWHGPYGSQTGFLMVVRAVGGRLDNVIDDKRVPVDYDPEFRPVVPETLREHLRPGVRQRCW
jgi:hypothetical protein